MLEQYRFWNGFRKWGWRWLLWWIKCWWRRLDEVDYYVSGGSWLFIVYVLSWLWCMWLVWDS